MPKILVVDDDALISACLNTYLRKDGYQVWSAGNGVEALDVLNSVNIDLIVTDLNMPLMDGFGLIDEMINMELRISVIVMSGNLDEGTINRLHGLGVRHCLEKPFDLKELCIKVAEELYGLNNEHLETVSV